MEYDYEFDCKSKLGLTWKVNLEEDVFVDNEKSTCEILIWLKIMICVLCLG